MAYSPKIDQLLIERLYRLKHSGKKKKVPMTKMVNTAVTEYLERQEKAKAEPA